MKIVRKNIHQARKYLININNNIVGELRDIAKEHDLRGYYRLGKPDMIAFLS